MTLTEGMLAVLRLAGWGVAIWAVLARSRAAALAMAAEARLREAQEQEEREAARAREAEQKAASLEVRRAQLEEQIESLRREHEAKLEHQQQINAAHLKAVEQKEQELRARMEELSEKLEKTFGSLAGEALDKSNRKFLELAQERFKPMGETLERAKEQLAQVTKHLDVSRQTTEGLREETERLVRALARPEVRGRYGEIQLRRIAEIAGMKSYCDYAEQDSVRSSDGKLLRPDMLVKLPGGRVIAVDAKAPLDAFLAAAQERDPDAQEKRLEQYAKRVAQHVSDLSGKGYWAHYADESVDFVVLFLPGDHFLDAALARKPELIEHAAQKNVIMASPATLIGLLRAVAVGWTQHRFAEQAQELIDLGRELHSRAQNAWQHLAKLGRQLDSSVDAYNDAIGSIDRRLNPTLRKFEELGARGKDDLPELPPVEVRSRDGTPLLDTPDRDEES